MKWNTINHNKRISQLTKHHAVYLWSLWVTITEWKLSTFGIDFLRNQTPFIQSNSESIKPIFCRLSSTLLCRIWISSTDASWHHDDTWCINNNQKYVYWRKYIANIFQWEVRQISKHETAWISESPLTYSLFIYLMVIPSVLCILPFWQILAKTFFYKIIRHFGNTYEYASSFFHVGWWSLLHGKS